MRSKHIVFARLKVFGHSKVSEFVHSFIVQNISRLDISVNNVEADHLLAPFKNLKHDLNGLLLSLSLVNALHLQIGLAMLHNQINTVLFINDFKQFDYIVVINVSQNVYLVL